MDLLAVGQGDGLAVFQLEVKDGEAGIERIRLFQLDAPASDGKRISSEDRLAPQGRPRMTGLSRSLTRFHRSH